MFLLPLLPRLKGANMFESLSEKLSGILDS